MLSEKHLELLTAFVDGELNQRQRKSVLRLVHKSRSARRLLKQLQKDSRQLAALPAKLPPKNLAPLVVSSIAEKEIPVTVPATPSMLVEAPVPLSNWIGLFVAACVLIGVSIASYLHFAEKPAEQQTNPIVVKNNPIIEPVVPEAPNVPEIKPAPPVVEFALADFGKKEVRKQLAQELWKETSYSMNLTTGDNARAVKELETALKQTGIKLLADGPTKKTVEEGKKVTYVIYVEDVQPFEVPMILQSLAKQSPTKKTNVQNVAFNTISQDKRGELATLLGVKVEDLQPAEKNDKIIFPIFPDDPTIIPAPNQQNPTKPEKGQTKNKNQPNKGGSKKADRLAVMLALDSSAGPQASSVAVQNFMQARNKVRPENTLQLVIVLEESHA